MKKLNLTSHKMINQHLIFYWKKCSNKMCD